MTVHEYSTHLTWSGSTGDGYRTYSREHELRLSSEPLLLSADVAFRGDADLPNPEQLLLAAASSCQLLSFLAVAAQARLDVVAYADEAVAQMPDAPSGMRITEIVLRPRVTVRGSDEETVVRHLETAHGQCYIANTLNATMRIEPTVEVV